MLILCSSCNSKYLINSVDLKPSGRNVQCAKCGFNWFQKPIFSEEEQINTSVSSIKSDQFKKQVNTSTKSFVSNLPSTYVKEEKPSFINSLFLIIFIIILIIFFWLTKNEELDLFQLIKFYILEFYFNLQLIINDIAKLTYQILN